MGLVNYGDNDFVLLPKELIKVDSDNGFDKYVTIYVIKTYVVGEGCLLINTETGETKGPGVYKFYRRFYDENGVYYPDGIDDKLCYDIIQDPKWGQEVAYA